MKWIGQHIYDLASRFRNDVFLEDISIGTIAFGAHLGLDSNNKIVRAADGGGDLTSIVAGTGLSGTSLTGPIPTLNVDASQTQITAVGTIGTGAWQGTAITAAYIAAAQTNITSLGTLTALQVDNININANTITASSDLTLDVTGDIDIDAGGEEVTVDSDVFTFLSGVSNKPIVRIRKTGNDTTAPEFRFQKDKGAVGVDGDDIGVINFVSDDTVQTQTTFARILAEVSEADNTDEAGKLTLSVAESDGTTTALTAGLVIEGEHATDGQVNVTIAAGAASVTTVAGDLTVNGDTVTFQSANADDPHVVIKNTHDSTNNGARLDFNKLRADDGAEQGMNLGEIWFTGQDNAQNAQDYAYIIGEIDVGTSGQESGALKLGVASHDGDIELAGLTLTGGSVNDEIDVIIGNGAASTTTVAGTLTMGSTATLTNAGLLSVAGQTNITSLGTLTALTVDNIGINGDTITASGDLAIVATGNDIAVDTDTFTIESATNHLPKLEIKSTHNGGDGGRLSFQKDRGAAQVNDDIMGTIFWGGENDAEEPITYGLIEVSALEVDDTDEAGRMKFQVAESNGTAVTVTTGLLIEGSDNTTDGEVNVTIAAGAASTTTVAGKFTCASRTLAIQGATDGQHHGDVVYFGSTTSMTIGKIYHYKSDGTWEIANADAIATSDGLLAVALGAASDTNGMLLRGIVVLDHDPGAMGDVLYVQSDNAGTPGNATATAPSASGDCVRIIGYQIAHAANGNIWFNPDSTFVEVA